MKPSKNQYLQIVIFIKQSGLDPFSGSVPKKTGPLDRHKTGLRPTRERSETNLKKDRKPKFINISSFVLIT